MIKLTSETRDELVKIAKIYGHEMEVVDDPNFAFEEDASRGLNLVRIRSFIDPQHFDYLFEQISQAYKISHDQDMFVFNLFHGIGHFKLNLWKGKYENPIIARLENLEHDKKVNDWAYKEFIKWKENIAKE